MDSRQTLCIPAHSTSFHPCIDLGELGLASAAMPKSLPNHRIIRYNLQFYYRSWDIPNGTYTRNERASCLCPTFRCGSHIHRLLFTSSQQGFLRSYSALSSGFFLPFSMGTRMDASCNTTRLEELLSFLQKEDVHVKNRWRFHKMAVQFARGRIQINQDNEVLWRWNVGELGIRTSMTPPSPYDWEDR